MLEAFRRPPGRFFSRRFAHHQAAGRPQEADRTLGRHRRRTERPGHDGVERLPQVGAAGGLLRPGLDHRHVGPAEGFEGLPQEAAGPLPGLEERQFQCRPEDGYNEPGQAAAAPEIEDAARLRQPGQEGAAVLDLPGQGAGPQESELLGPQEKIVEALTRSFRDAQEEPAGALMTTRRRGSSPSEMVDTPSISLTMSWTILRSSGDIGSKTWSLPDSRAR